MRLTSLSLRTVRGIFFGLLGRIREVAGVSQVCVAKLVDRHSSLRLITSADIGAAGGIMSANGSVDSH